MENTSKASILKSIREKLELTVSWGPKTDMFIWNLIDILELHKMDITIANIIALNNNPSSLGKLSIPDYNRIVHERYADISGGLIKILEWLSEDVQNSTLN